MFERIIGLTEGDDIFIRDGGNDIGCIIDLFGYILGGALLYNHPVHDQSAMAGLFCFICTLQKSVSLPADKITNTLVYCPVI